MKLISFERPRFGDVWVNRDLVTSVVRYGSESDDQPKTRISFNNDESAVVVFGTPDEVAQRLQG